MIIRWYEFLPGFQPEMFNEVNYIDLINSDYIIDYLLGAKESSGIGFVLYLSLPSTITLYHDRVIQWFQSLETDLPYKLTFWNGLSINRYFIRLYTDNDLLIDTYYIPFDKIQFLLLNNSFTTIKFDCYDLTGLLYLTAKYVLEVPVYNSTVDQMFNLTSGVVSASVGDLPFLYQTTVDTIGNKLVSIVAGMYTASMETGSLYSPITSSFADEYVLNLTIPYNFAVKLPNYTASVMITSSTIPLDYYGQTTWNNNYAVYNSLLNHVMFEGTTIGNFYDLNDLFVPLIPTQGKCITQTGLKFNGWFWNIKIYRSLFLDDYHEDALDNWNINVRILSYRWKFDPRQPLVYNKVYKTSITQILPYNYLGRLLAYALDYVFTQDDIDYVNACVMHFFRSRFQLYSIYNTSPYQSFNDDILNGQLARYVDPLGITWSMNDVKPVLAVLHGVFLYGLSTNPYRQLSFDIVAEYLNQSNDYSNLNSQIILPKTWYNSNRVVIYTSGNGVIFQSIIRSFNYDNEVLTVINDSVVKQFIPIINTDLTVDYFIPKDIKADVLSILGDMLILANGYLLADKLGQYIKLKNKPGLQNWDVNNPILITDSNIISFNKSTLVLDKKLIDDAVLYILSSDVYRNILNMYYNMLTTYFNYTINLSVWLSNYTTSELYVGRWITVKDKDYIITKIKTNYNDNIYLIACLGNK